MTCKPADQESERSPFVSVVVPVFNAPERIRTCIEALFAQTYPYDRYEIIVVDNGSTDKTPRVIEQYPVRFLVEDEIQSPYAARNKALQVAQGEIIAFIDANCTPIREWLDRGVHTMQSQEADLAGGKVTFTFSCRRTAAELLDSIVNVNIERSIQTRGVAKGGNLFIRRETFDSIGLFPAGLRSGGDVLWTGMATEAGLKLVYAGDAEAFYPARPLLPLLRKQVRVGRGQVAIWERQGLPASSVIVRMAKGILPPSPLLVHRGLRRQEIRAWTTWLSVWIVGWVCKIATTLGRLQGLAEMALARR